MSRIIIEKGSRFLPRLVSNTRHFCYGADHVDFDAEQLNISSEEILKASKEKPQSGVNSCPNSCLCSNNINIDYKNVRLLSQFVSSQTGMLFPRTYTKICMTKQREIAKAVKRSRAMGKKYQLDV
jgi:ribosomal protein S18